jgi:hypothetical protein
MINSYQEMTSSRKFGKKSRSLSQKSEKINWRANEIGTS